MARGRYFVDRKSGASIIIRVFLVLLLLFSIVFFLWSVMKYNDIMDEKKEKQEYIDSLSEQIDRLEYYVDAPIDDAYKIRMAREKLGMCFPDDIIFQTELN